MNPVLPVVHGWLRPGVRSDAEASEEAMCVDSQDEQWLKSHFRLYLLFGFSYYSSAHNPCLYSFCQRLVLNSTLIILALNQMYFLALLFFFFLEKCFHSFLKAITIVIFLLFSLPLFFNNIYFFKMLIVFNFNWCSWVILIFLVVSLYFQIYLQWTLLFLNFYL